MFAKLPLTVQHDHILRYRLDVPDIRYITVDAVVLVMLWLKVHYTV